MTTTPSKRSRPRKSSPLSSYHDASYPKRAETPEPPSSFAPQPPVYSICTTPAGEADRTDAESEGT